MSSDFQCASLSSSLVPLLFWWWWWGEGGGGGGGGGGRNVLGDQCISLFVVEITSPFPDPVPKFGLAPLGQACAEFCDNDGGGTWCLPKGFTGVDVKETFESLGVTCASETAYDSANQPSYAPATKHCYGTSNLTAQIECFAFGSSDPPQRQLCPCKGESAYA